MSQQYFNLDEVRGDIRRSLMNEVRRILVGGGFVQPNKLLVRYSTADQMYVVHMTFGDAVHMFDIANSHVTVNEAQALFEVLAEDARVPIAEGL